MANLLVRLLGKVLVALAVVTVCFSSWGMCIACGDDGYYMYGNQGMTLPIPNKYKDLLILGMHPEYETDTMFSVREKASVRAAQNGNWAYEGEGWIFSIGRIDTARLHEMLCEDMSGREVFARDNGGNHYIYYHPTDVRYYRETAEQMAKDQEQWTKLNEWAWTSARKDFIGINSGLVPETFDNSEVAIYLNRILYKPNFNYTVSTVEYGPLKSTAVDPAPFVNQLLNGATYEMVGQQEYPDGEYVVLNFPDEKTRLDFFLLEGKENYVRCVVHDEGAMLYKAHFTDAGIKASKIMQEWYHALAAKEITK